MKNLSKKFSFKNSVKLIICIVTFSACVSCHMRSVEIEQSFKRITNDDKPYVVSTYIVDYNRKVAEGIIYVDIEFCKLDSINLLMQKQYRKAEKAKTILLSIEKH